MYFHINKWQQWITGKTKHILKHLSLGKTMYNRSTTYAYKLLPHLAVTNYSQWQQKQSLVNTSHTAVFECQPILENSLLGEGTFYFQDRGMCKTSKSSYMWMCSQEEELHQKLNIWEKMSMLRLLWTLTLSRRKPKWKH